MRRVLGRSSELFCVSVVRASLTASFYGLLKSKFDVAYKSCGSRPVLLFSSEPLGEEM